MKILGLLKQLFHSHNWQAIPPTGTVNITHAKTGEIIGTAEILTKECSGCKKMETTIFNEERFQTGKN